MTIRQLTGYVDNQVYVKQDAYDFVRRVKRSIDNIVTEFLTIGKELKLAQEKKYYEKLGYSTIEELSSELFGIRKSTCYNLMNLFERCSDGVNVLPEYSGYSQTQLVELVSVKELPNKFLEITTPEDSAKKIRQAKKIWHEKQSEIQASDVKSIDELITKFSSRLENNDVTDSEKQEISQKLHVLEVVKQFMAENNCVCFIAPKGKRAPNKNTKFMALLEDYITNIANS